MKATRMLPKPEEEGEEEQGEEDGDALEEGESRPEAEEGEEDRLIRNRVNGEIAVTVMRGKITTTNPRGGEGRRGKEGEEEEREEQAHQGWNKPRPYRPILSLSRSREQWEEKIHLFSKL